MSAGKNHTIAAAASVATSEDTGERRRWPRYAVMAMARVIEPRSMAKADGRCTDLGIGGCYVDTINSFPTGSIVQVSVWQGSRRFESQASVVYSLSGMGMGLVFTEMEASKRAILQAWVRELSCGLETEPGQSDPAPAPPAAAPQPSQSGASPERAVLTHLIDLLARRRYITTQEAEDLLRELFS